MKSDRPTLIYQAIVNSAHSADETVDVPLRDSLNGYIMIFVELNLRISDILGTPEAFTQPMRIYYLVKQMISLITDTEIRDMINEHMSKEITERAKDKDEEELQHIQLEVSIDTIKFITMWIDKHVGLSVENRIGVA